MTLSIEDRLAETELHLAAERIRADRAEIDAWQYSRARRDAPPSDSSREHDARMALAHDRLRMLETELATKRAAFEARHGVLAERDGFRRARAEMRVRHEKTEAHFRQRRADAEKQLSEAMREVADNDGRLVQSRYVDIDDEPMVENTFRGGRVDRVSVLRGAEMFETQIHYKQAFETRDGSSNSLRR